MKHGPIYIRFFKLILCSDTLTTPNFPYCVSPYNTFRIFFRSVFFLSLFLWFLKRVGHEISAVSCMCSIFSLRIQTVCRLGKARKMNGRPSTVGVVTARKILPWLQTHTHTQNTEHVLLLNVGQSNKNREIPLKSYCKCFHFDVSKQSSRNPNSTANSIARVAFWKATSC